jgi:hypothetical protein
MITHTILFRLKQSTSVADRARLATALRDFAQDPPFAVGPGEVAEDGGLSERSPATADVLLRVQFPDAEALPRYMADERHVALVQNVLRPLCDTWLALQAES